MNGRLAHLGQLNGIRRAHRIRRRVIVETWRLDRVCFYKCNEVLKIEKKNYLGKQNQPQLNCVEKRHAYYRSDRRDTFDFV